MLGKWLLKIFEHFYEAYFENEKLLAITELTVLADVIQKIYETDPVNARQECGNERVK